MEFFLVFFRRKGTENWGYYAGTGHNKCNVNIAKRYSTIANAKRSNIIAGKWNALFDWEIIEASSDITLHHVLAKS